jgi:predicted small secreted protein
MKKFISAIIVALALISVFTACERNDYQHPMHRK